MVAFKDIAPYIAAHILKPTQVPAVYAKLTLVTFTSLSRDDRGTFYSVADFVQVANSLKVMNSQTRMMNYALINGMANFTKDNKLDNVIRPSEIHKLWDPDDPNDNPPPLGQGRE